MCRFGSRTGELDTVSKSVLEAEVAGAATEPVECRK